MRYAARRSSTAGSTIDKGNLVMRNGIIEESAPTPPCRPMRLSSTASNMTVYPGLIDMTNTTAVEPRAAVAPDGPSPRRLRAGGGRGRGAHTATPTWADGDRAKREALLNPDVEAANSVRYDGIEMQRLASAGITSVLAVPPSGLFRGRARSSTSWRRPTRTTSAAWRATGAAPWSSRLRSRST